MRASTLFALSAAILLGLGAVVFAKYAGWFERSPVTEQKKAPYQILVAKTNLFEGTTVSANDVMIRNVREDELPEYLKYQKSLMQATPFAAHQRILAKSVGADQWLMTEHFIDLKLPTSLTGRLEPNMRSITLTLPADQAAGGLLQLNERVDVYLTADVCMDPRCQERITKTAQIARGVKVIVKRNTLWLVMAPVEPGGKVTLGLEANAYRAALIEYAKNKGSLTLVPAPASGGLLVPKGGRKSFSDPDSEEYRDEDARVAGVMNGEMTVGDQDLMRIFRVKQAPPPPPPTYVERFSGVNPVGTYVFPYASGGSGVSYAEPPSGGVAGRPASVFFLPPGARSPKDCPTCGK